jgi:hypothetical protein
MESNTPLQFSNLPDRALSVRQPWACAILYAGKDIENRSWHAINHGLTVRGRIVLHAAKGMTRVEYEDAKRFMESIGVKCPPPADLLRGAIIGTVEVVDVVKKHPSPWFFGPRGLVLRNAQAFDAAPCSGALGYFNWRSGLAAAFSPPAQWMLSAAAQPRPQADLF